MLLAGLAALGALATNIILPAFPDMARELGTSVKDLSATLGTFFVAFAIGQLFVGPLSDRFGRRPVLLGGMAVYCVASLLAIAAPSFETLLLARECIAWGATAEVLTEANLQRARAMAEAWDETAAICDIDGEVNGLDFDTLLAGAVKDPALKRRVARDVILGIVQEGGLEELPQGVSEQVLENQRTGRPLEEVRHVVAAGRTAFDDVLGAEECGCGSRGERSPSSRHS